MKEQVNFANNNGGGVDKSVIMPLFCVPQNAGFYFMLSSHHPNNCLENIYIFYFPLFISHKIFLGRKNIGWVFAPPPPQVTPMDEKYIEVYIILGSFTSFQIIFSVMMVQSEPKLRMYDIKLNEGLSAFTW